MAKHSVVWMNNRLVPAAKATLSTSDRGVLYGDGVFETLRAYDGRVFALERHLERLAAGAAALRLPLPISLEEIGAAVYETLTANELDNASVRVTLTRGPGAGIALPEAPTPTLFIAARGLKADLSGRPCTARLVSFRRNEHSPLVRLKSLNYLECLLAREEARAAGADEGLFRNTRGDLAEGAASNLFLVRGGVLMTPDEASGILPGITRQVVLELAQRLGIPLRVSPVSLLAMRAAHEAFLTNTLIEIAPLVAVDGRPVGSGQPGPVTGQLAAAYRELVAGER